ncbi:hypothetical protein BS47DRAFT_1350586, partial [Hydnum rufescens UP504]
MRKPGEYLPTQSVPCRPFWPSRLKKKRLPPLATWSGLIMSIFPGFIPSLTGGHIDG